MNAVDSGSGETVVVSSNSSGDKLSGGVLAGIVILGLIAMHGNHSCTDDSLHPLCHCL